jgi:hypothetical protein
VTPSVFAFGAGTNLRLRQLIARRQIGRCAAQQPMPVTPHLGGMTMSTLPWIELTGLPRMPWSGAGFPGRPANPTEYFRLAYVFLPAAMIAGLAAWVLLSGDIGKPAASQAAPLAAAEAAPAPAVAVPHALNPPVATGEAIVPEQTAPVDGLKISSQYWRRGGLGSNALVTFTLRNANDYAVKDIEITCAFSRRDGSHLTDRTRMIHDTVNMKGRKTFAHLHVGFVNINASKAKCAPVAARHV